MTRRLESSITARWRTRTEGSSESTRHWHTRVGYYRAVARALDAAEAGEIEARDILVHHESGRASTLYAVASRNSLLRAYRTHSERALAQLGDLVPAEPVAQLVAAVKVWSFWPARVAWVQELDGCYPTGAFGTAAGGLLRALREWGAAHPALARAAGGLPPLCAVEDLTILGRSALSPTRSARLLRDAVASGTLDVPRDVAGDVPAPRCPALDEVLAGAVTRIDTAVELMGGRSGEGGAAPAVALLRATARELETLHRRGTAP